MHSWSGVFVPQLPSCSNPEVDNRVRVWDAESRSLKVVGPSSGTAGLYVCGITPYDATHLGHAFTYLTFDLLQRAWRDQGLDVIYVQNVTDVDDPLLERAVQTDQDWRELANSQIELFRTDMEALRVLPPDHFIGVSEAFDLVTDAVHRLQQKGLAYQVADSAYPDWYFRTALTDGFGEISHLSTEQQLAEFAEKGGDPDRPGKKDAFDSLVWRLERPDEPAWNSSLGRGRPGWHVECSAIAQRYLGNDFSVQGGGRDLAFPHHEMSAATGQAITGHPFAQAYVHVGMVGMDGEKMSKSLGNLELVSRLRAQGIAPSVIRLALLSHHYRADWEWFADQIDEAHERAERWAAAFRAPSGAPAGSVLDQLRAAMRTDLDSPRALAVVDEWSAATLAGASDPHAPEQVAQAVDALLGVSLV